MDPKEVEKEIIEEFAILSDWTEKYEQLIYIGKQLPPVPDHLKIDKYLIKGCQSKVWLIPECKNGAIKFTADSDTLITRGLIALLLRVVQHMSPHEIINYDFSFIKEIGLEHHLSPTRSNGLHSMINTIKEEAYKCLKGLSTP